MTAAAWFTRVGLPWSAAETAVITLLAESAPGFARCVAQPVLDWRAAAQLVRMAGCDDPSWYLEEEERQRLWERATLWRLESEIAAHVAEVTSALETPIRAAARTALAGVGVGDRACVRAAAGTALLSAQHAALVELAREPPTHYWVRRHALFTGGRWPLGYHRGAFLVF